MTTNVPRDPTAPVLAVTELSTIFDTPTGRLVAVDAVSFTVNRGETLGIVGESGSGKSVLARSVLGLLARTASTEGSVMFGDIDLRRLAPKDIRALRGKEMSMVFQDPSAALNPVKRVGDQVAEPLRVHSRLSRTEARERAVLLLEQVGIADAGRRIRSYPHELSGGMRQRICIAVAIACSPQLLFADEPTTALDVTIQRQILDLMSALQAENGMAVVLVTHDFGVVASRARRVLVMYAGQLVESGLTTTIFEAPRHPYTASLLASVPKLDHPSHSILPAIPGQPARVVEPTPGCRFAPRCRYAQPQCLVADPPIDADNGHGFACFYPVGTDAGAAALASNVSAGRTAAGLPLVQKVVS